MIFEKIKSDMILAMKEGRKTDKEILSLALGQLKNKLIDLRSNTIDDATSLSIIKKIIKQLDEEIAAYKNAERFETVRKLESQKELLTQYLPKQLKESEILEIINTLDDKSIPSVMKYFKLNYSGQCDMSIVNKVLRSLWFGGLYHSIIAGNN